MNARKNVLVLLSLLITFSMVFGSVLASDGIMFRRNVPKTPDQETERANINHMSFYVPAQSSQGELVSIEYLAADTTTLVETREYAKPLVSVYIDSLPEVAEDEEGIYQILSGAGFGDHDAYASVSLDDGSTWKRTNLSMSADLSSFTLANGLEYPGDAHNMTFTIAGDKVLIGWISKYCDGGSPLYTLADDAIEALQTTFALPDLYVHDIWGVAGAQGSVDYAQLGYPEAGEIPYSCVWSARGQLLEDLDTGLFELVWTKAERLTSGVRDANRLEMAGDSAAGFMMTWQEDPEGLRPGDGLGPGEGWSGAVVNAKTDLWYSFISLENFVLVQTSDTDVTPVAIAEYTGDTMPKVAVPMAMPIRLTDNDMCKSANSDPYCYIDFDDVDPYGATVLPDILPAAPISGSTFCETTISWTTPGGSSLTLCQAEDLRVLGGRVGASRPRVNVQPYDSTVDTIALYDSAIVIMGAEESKALGEGTVDDLDGDEVIEPEDIGKNMWYYNFDLLNPAFVQQGLMLNQPAIDPETDTFFEPLTDDFGFEFYETEISRRFSHMSQPIHQFGETGIGAVLIVKQGIINQGGPADIFLRLTQVPEDVWLECETDGDNTTEERCLPEGYNPYAYENMVCEDLEGNELWEYEDGSNPRYLEGLCMSNMINVSGTSIVSCDGTAGDCSDAFPWDGVADLATFPKVTEWEQIPENVLDQSWTNPYDVSKGHRGFIDGDFIMMMYAWSPNWQANAIGNDHYNLYARRSFDGGATWTTTPAALGGDGTETCENYKNGITITTVCTTYGAGEFEQARNLSQLIGNKETILDPRYTPTGGLKMLPITDLKEISFLGYDDDVRDPSIFFIVYETGDNTTVTLGEATPLDLFYSRATNWGDDYDLVEYLNEGTGETVFGFDWLEHDTEMLSGEAANTCNNGGTYYYVIWNQWMEDEEENVSNSDAFFRRLMWLDDDTTTGTLPVPYILSAPSAALFSDQLSFVGSGFDPDNGDTETGIVSFDWYSSIDGLIGSGQILEIAADQLSSGRHIISLVVTDDEGMTSSTRTILVITGGAFHTTMPMVRK